MRSQVKRAVVGATLAAVALWGAWYVSKGGDTGGAGASNVSGEMHSLRVDVSGVRGDLGHVIGSLCSKGQEFPSGCRLRARSKAQKGVVSLDFKGLQKGEYALALYHDENANDLLELGTEGIGFSNNANLAHAPPDFQASSIAVGGMTRIRVRIRYSL